MLSVCYGDVLGMGGDKLALKDLSDYSEPPSIELYCFEDLNFEEEKEVELVQVYPSIPPCEMHSFVLNCGACNSQIQFICRAKRDAVRTLQCLCLDSLKFICHSCALRLCYQ